MTKIFKTLLALCVLWFAVPYFYHSYLDNQVFRKIEKEYCEKDAGLMVFVDKIDFSQPIILRFKNISPDIDFTISLNSSQEIKGGFLDIQTALKKEKMYIQFDNTFGFWPGNTTNIYKEKLDVVKTIYLLNGVPITSSVFLSTLPSKCLQNNTCKRNDLKIEYAQLPTYGLKIEYAIGSQEEVVFHDYVLSREYRIQAFNIRNNQLLFSLKKYGYGGSIGYSETFNPYKQGLISDVTSLNLKQCIGESSKKAIKPFTDSVLDTTYLTYLREHYGN